MKRKKYMPVFLPMILCVALLPSCSNDPDSKDISPVHIRVKNNSDVDFETVKVWGTEYGRVHADQFSGYRTYDIAYEIATVSLTANNNQFSQTVIDYVGEEPLSRGYYTLYLNILEPETGSYLVQERLKD
jgi:hypothetical protein